MSDDRLRELERAYLSSGSQADLVAWEVEQVRNGLPSRRACYDRIMGALTQLAVNKWMKLHTLVVQRPAEHIMIDFKVGTYGDLFDEVQS